MCKKYVNLVMKTLTLRLYSVSFEFLANSTNDRYRTVIVSCNDRYRTVAYRIRIRTRIIFVFECTTTEVHSYNF